MDQNREREYLFDNYKALLILLVVTGHFVEIASSENQLLDCVKWLIFSFHMPAFIFISGYFSKKPPKIKSLIRKLIVPYLVFEVLYFLLYTFVIHKETQLWLLYPKFTLWYLLALFVWKAVTPLVIKIPYHLVLAILAGLITGVSGLDDNFLTLPRMIVFYPFFLLGVHMDKEMIVRLREKATKRTAGIALGILAAGLVCMSVFTDMPPRVFHGRYDYAQMNQGAAEGIVTRLFCYGISLAVTLLILCVISDKKNRVSYLGGRTMAIYLFHGLICSWLKAKWEYFEDPGIAFETVFLLAASLAVTGVLSLKPFTAVLNKMTGAGRKSLNHIPTKA